MVKSSIPCDSCGKSIPKYMHFETLEKPKRHLCNSCWYKWVGLNNPKESKE